MSPAHSALGCPGGGKDLVRRSRSPRSREGVPAEASARLTWQLGVPAEAGTHLTRPGAAASALARWLRWRLEKIRQVTDVSHCKLHQYLSCNSEIACQ